MLIKVVNLIDANGMYVEPQMLQIAETLEEARQLNYPIARRKVRNESPTLLEDPPELKALRSRLAGLNAIPEKDDAIDNLITQTEIQIQSLSEDLEARRQENEWIEIEEFTVPPLSAYQIEEPVPDGFWHPKWDGFRWIEGLTPAEIDARIPKFPNWDGFVNDWLASDLDDAIAQTTNIVWLTRLQLAIDKRPNIDIPWLVTTWNKCVEGMPNAFTAAQIKTASGWIKKYNLPISIGKNGVISEPQQ